MKCLYSGDADEFQPGGLLLFQFRETGVEIIRHDDVADDVQCTLLQCVAELDKLPLRPRISDK